MTWRRIAPWVILIIFVLAAYVDLPREWLPQTLPGSGLKTVLGGHQPHNRPMLAVRPQPADDCLGLDPHPRGWK